MKPSSTPAGNGSSLFTVIAVVVGFALLVWLVVDSTGLFKSRSSSHAGIVDVTTETWQKEVIDSKTPVLVDFWAPWCGPCVALSPTIEKIATTYSGRVKVCKVNVDEAPALARKFGIEGIPIVFVFNKGERVDVVQPIDAPISERDLASALDKVLTQ